MTTRTPFLIALSASVLVGAAIHRATSPPGPDVLIDDPSLVQMAGALMYEGVPFTGRLVAHHPDGSLQVATEYRDGLRDGTSQGWYANGQRSWTRSYDANREVGTHRGWWEDGGPRFVYRFEGGVLDGEALEWFPDGTMYRAFTYAAGKESGSQRMWYPDGSLRATYVVKDGRRYGLIGSKGCVTDDEAEVGT